MVKQKELAALVSVSMDQRGRVAVDVGMLGHCFHRAAWRDGRWQVMLNGDWCPLMGLRGQPTPHGSPVFLAKRYRGRV
jgi:hypothetical protein